MLKNIAALSLLAAAAFGSNLLASGQRSDIVSRAEANLAGNGITMAIAFQNRLDRNGLDVSVHARGLIPDMAYPYHIHVGPVPKDGNCTATLGHFDPAHVNTDPKTYHCDPKAMETTCELGDLAGRHGNITASAGGTFGAYYSDPLLALDGPNSIIGRSVVIHAPNNTRLACADIVPVV